MLNIALDEGLKTRLDTLNQPNGGVVEANPMLKVNSQQKGELASFFIFTNEDLLRSYLYNIDQ